MTDSKFTNKITSSKNNLKLYGFKDYFSSFGSTKLICFFVKLQKLHSELKSGAQDFSNKSIKVVI